MKLVGRIIKFNYEINQLFDSYKNILYTRGYSYDVRSSINRRKVTSNLFYILHENYITN